MKSPKEKIAIIPEYYNSFKTNFKLTNEVTNKYSERIKTIIIELNKNKNKISPKNIQNLY